MIVVYNEIEDLEAQLKNSDYKAIKYAEGLLTEEEYLENEDSSGKQDLLNENGKKE